MKIGLDTNVVIRLLVDDDKDQAAKAEKRISQISSLGGTIFISNLVALECIWVLSARYKVDNDTIIDSLYQLSQVSGFEFENVDLIHQINDLSGSGSANLGDLLIGTYNRMLNCDTTITFDRKAAKSDVFSTV